jgi:antirestriction protein ArdC
MNNYNIVTGKVYEGQNQADLMNRSEIAKFKSKKWGTFLQWKGLNIKIKKGEHGVHIFKGFGEFDAKNKEGKRITETRPLGFATIFNEDQTEKII